MDDQSQNVWLTLTPETISDYADTSKHIQKFINEAEEHSSIDVNVIQGANDGMESLILEVRFRDSTAVVIDIDVFDKLPAKDYASVGILDSQIYFSNEFSDIKDLIESFTSTLTTISIMTLYYNHLISTLQNIANNATNGNPSQLVVDINTQDLLTFMIRFNVYHDSKGDPNKPDLSLYQYFIHQYEPVIEFDGGQTLDANELILHRPLNELDADARKLYHGLKEFVDNFDQFAKENKLYE